MQNNLKSFAAALGSVALTVSLFAAPASAQDAEGEASLSSRSSGSSDASASEGSSVSEEDALKALRAWNNASSQRPGSSGVTLDLGLSSLKAFGSSDFEVPEMFQEDSGNFPYEIDESITSVELINREWSPQDNKQAENEQRRIERWTVASPSMGRNMTVDVRLPDGSGPAPTVVMLDGVSARERNGWLYSSGRQAFDSVLGDENATVVFPLDATATWYADWIEDDPVFGRQKWETFIVEELLPLVEQQPDISSNGKRATGGLSMGAAGAVHLANAYPDVFNATFGISGCYSPTSPIGEQIFRLVPESRGGDVENMWGPVGSEEWVRHDVAQDPSGLLDQAVYLSSADGSLEELPAAGEKDTIDFIAGTYLERGVLTCTQELDRSLTKHGKDDHEVHYKGHGLHDWDNYVEELAPAWEHIRPALY